MTPDLGIGLLIGIAIGFVVGMIVGAHLEHRAWVADMSATHALLRRAFDVAKKAGPR